MELPFGSCNSSLPETLSEPLFISDSDSESMPISAMEEPPNTDSQFVTGDKDVAEKESTEGCNAPDDNLGAAKDRILGFCTLVEEDAVPRVYELPVQELSRVDKIRHCEIVAPNFDKSCVQIEKTILFIGVTGSGKTTLLNAFVNYLFGVNWEDSYRFVIIPDREDRHEDTSKSQTRLITIYDIYVVMPATGTPSKITFIDSPGFGDTGGIEQDDRLEEMFQSLFSDPSETGKPTVNSLDAVCFTMQSSDSRAGGLQMYIYHRVLSIFGKDIAPNIFIMATFADGKPPQVVKVLEQREVPFKKYFKFNNSALFANNSKQENDSDEDNEDSFEEMFWKMGFRSICAFFKFLEKSVGPVDIELTRRVVNERQSLKVYVFHLNQLIKQGWSTLNVLQQEISVVKKHEKDIEDNKNFNYTVHETIYESKEVPQGKYITNCLTCNRTCHKWCGIRKNSKKAKCSAMKPNGFCHVCEATGADCFWDKHVNMDIYYEPTTKPVTRTYEEMVQRYETAKGEKMSSLQLVDKIKNEFEELNAETLWRVNEMKNCLKKLDKMALKPNSMTCVDYLQQFLEAEMSERLPGYEERIEQLKNAIVQTQQLQELADQGEIDLWGDFTKGLEAGTGLAENVQSSYEEMKGFIVRFKKYVKNGVVKKYTSMKKYHSLKVS